MSEYGLGYEHGQANVVGNMTVILAMEMRRVTKDSDEYKLLARVQALLETLRPRARARV